MKFNRVSLTLLIALSIYISICWGRPVSSMVLTVGTGNGANHSEIRLLVQSKVDNLKEVNEDTDPICNAFSLIFGESRKNISISFIDNGALKNKSENIYLNFDEGNSRAANNHKALIPNATIVVNGSPALLVVIVFLGILLFIFALLLALMCNKDENHKCEESRYVRNIKPI